MSLPEESIEPLLSGYLDGVLSDDDMVRADELLRRDAGAASRLAEMRALRTSLRHLHRQQARSLGPEFAERTVEGAIARAQAEGLHDSHPLMQLAEQPADPQAPSRRLKQASWAACMLAVAATLLVAIAFFARDGVPGGDGQPALVADRGGVAEDATVTADSGPAPETAADPIEENVRAPVTTKQLADSRPQNPSSERHDAAAPPTPGRSNDRVDIASTSRDQPPETEMGSDRAAEGNDGGSAIVSEPVMVVNVRRTQLGRASSAVRRALLRAGLSEAAQQATSRELVGAVADAIEGIDEDQASLHYLRAPARQFDRLIGLLSSDMEGIESVQLGLALNVPVRQPLSREQVDPRTVKQGYDWQFGGSKSEQMTWLRTLGGLTYQEMQTTATPNDGGRSAGPTMVTGSEGEDVIVYLIVLVQ